MLLVEIEKKKEKYFYSSFELNGFCCPRLSALTWRRDVRQCWIRYTGGEGQINVLLI